MGDREAAISSADVMLSFRHEELDAASRLADWLGDHFGGSRVFIDTRIQGGDRFPVEIEAAIRDCDVVVAVIGPAWRDDLDQPDDWVRRELRLALEVEKLIVPVLLGGVEPPGAAELPPDLAPLAEAQMVPIGVRSYRDNVAELVAVLERHISAPLPRTAFPEVPAGDRPEARAAWDAPGTLERVRGRLLEALTASAVRVADEVNGELRLAAGSKWKARLIGSFTGPEKRLPIEGRLRLTDRDASVLVEVLLAEDWGPGLMVALSGRYESRFDKVIAALRQATARR